MLRTFDVILMGVMVAAAVVTYSIKHKADLKLEEVRKLEAEIKLEKDTIDLLRADWALLTQPNRLHRLVNAYQDELGLSPTLPTQLAQPRELPMLRSQLPQPSRVRRLVRPPKRTHRRRARLPSTALRFRHPGRVFPVQQRLRPSPPSRAMKPTTWMTR